MFQFVGSIEAVISDIQNVASSEISARQLIALVEDEIRDRQATSTSHMEIAATPNNSKNCSNKYNYGTVFLLILKCLICILFMSLLGFVLFPRATMSSMSFIASSVTLNTNAKPKYNLSNTDWYFFALQHFRIISTSLQVEQFFPVSEVKIGGCMIKNPLYAEDETDCSLCNKVETFTSISNDDGKSPLLIENQNIRFGLGRFQQILNKESLMLNQHTFSVISNRNYIKTVADLKDNLVLEMLEQDKGANIYGTSLSYMSSHILRREFPRPQDFVNRVMLTYISTIYIDGENSPAFPIKTSSSDSNFMYIQCSGSRRLIFTPHYMCKDKCQTFSRIMKKGDIVIYSNLWMLDSEPFGNSMSIAFVDNFEIEQSSTSVNSDSSEQDSTRQ